MAWGAERGTERNPERPPVFGWGTSPWNMPAFLALLALALYVDTRILLHGSAAPDPADAALAAERPPESPAASLGPARLQRRDGRQVVLLAREQRGEFVDVRTDCDLDPAPYAALADRVLPRLREWFGPRRAQAAELPHYTIFLCSSVERMLEVERLSGEPTSQVAGRSFAFRGGFYGRSRMAMFVPESERWTRWTLVHELVHAVFLERTGVRADVIDEGLAELLPDWLLFSDEARPEDHISTYPTYESTCGAAALRPNRPSLHWLYGLDYWAFRDDRLGDLGFAASWALMKLLVESRDPDFAGRLQLLFTDLADGFSVQSALNSTFGLVRVELAWRERIRSWSQWKPWWGTWQDDGRDWSTTLTSWGSHLLLAHDQPGDRPFELGFTWRAPSADYVGLGFALGMRDEQNVALLSLIESERRVMLEVFRGGELERERSWPLPSGLEFDCQPIVLTCAPGRNARLEIGEFALPLDEVDPATWEGNCGLMAARLAYAPRRVEAKFTFLAPWNRIPAEENAPGRTQVVR